MRSMRAVFLVLLLLLILPLDGGWVRAAASTPQPPATSPSPTLEAGAALSPTVAVTVAAAATGTPVALTRVPRYVPPPLVSTKAGVAAEANGESVSLDLLQVLINVAVIRLQQTGVNLHTPAGLRLLTQQEPQILRNLIDAAIITAYARSQQVLPSKAQIDAQFAALQSSAGGAGAYAHNLEAQGYTVNAARILFAGSLAQNIVFAAVTKNASCPCDLHVRHILLAAKDKALAVRLAKELQANHGATFVALARQYSIDPQTKNNGGELGFLARGQTVPAFDKAVFSLKVGQISDPVQTPFGWHVIQVLETRPSFLSRQTAFTAWLNGQHAHAVIHTYVKLPPA